jgi:hypothetical protein
MKNSSDLDEIENANGFPNLYRRVQGLVGEQSFSLILPKQYANNLGIRKGDFVKVRQEENKIIIEKA